MLTLAFLAALILTGFSNGAITNRTIDDTNADSGGGTVEYGGSWNAGQTCPGCWLQPDPNQLVDGTWHEATNDVYRPGDRNLTLTFTGTAIYIFCVLPNTPVHSNYTVITAANMSFIVDGSFINTFHRDSLPTPDYIYNYPVFTRTGLANQEHTVNVQVLLESYMAFDYAFYTFDDGESPPPSSSPSNGGPTTTSKTGGTGTETPDPHSSPSPSPTSASSTGGSSSTSRTGENTTTSPTPPSSGRGATLPHTGSSFSSASGSATAGAATPGISARHSRKHTSTAAMVAGIVGGLAVVAVVVGALLCRRRRARRSRTATKQPGERRQHATRIPAMAPFNQFDAPSAFTREKKAEPAWTADLHSETMPAAPEPAREEDGPVSSKHSETAPLGATHSTNAESSAAMTAEENDETPGLVIQQVQDEAQDPFIQQVQDEAPGPVIQQVQDVSQQQQAEIERLRVELQEALAMHVEAPPPYQW